MPIAEGAKIKTLSLHAFQGPGRAFQTRAGNLPVAIWRENASRGKSAKWTDFARAPVMFPRKNCFLPPYKFAQTSMPVKFTLPATSCTSAIPLFCLLPLPAFFTP